MKNFRERFWKRCLALFLAVTMAVTVNVPGVDAVSVHAEETEKDLENTAAENYQAIVFGDKAEFDAVRNNPDILWEQQEDGIPSSYEEKWQRGADIGELLEEMSSEGAYAYVQPLNPAVEDHTVNIPAAMKGVIIATGRCEESDGSSYDFNIAADVLNIAGTETCVYFENTGIDTGGTGMLSINFASAENNSSKVVFKESYIDALIVCESESGTIEFKSGNIIRGLNNKCATELNDDASLLIKDAAGLSFEKITGNGGATIVFNGYPESADYLPRFNEEIDLGTGTDEEGNEYPQQVSIQFWQTETEPFWLDGTDEDWWAAASALELEEGTQAAYFAGTTRDETERIGNRVCYTFEDEQGNIREDLYLNPYTGKLEKTGEESAESTHNILKLDSASFEEIKKCIKGIDGKTEDILWDENGYGLLWEETDNPGASLESEGVEYVVIQARKASHDLADKTLELPENIKGAVLIADWDEQEDKSVPWQLDTLKVSGGTEVVVHGLEIDTQGRGLRIVTGSAADRVVFHNCIVDASIECDSANGTIVFSSVNTINGYHTNTATEFDGYVGYTEIYIKEAAGLSFEEIRGDADVSIIYNGYPENPDVLPHFNQAFNLGTGIDEETGNEYDKCVTVRFWQHQDLPFGMDGTEDWWEKVPAAALEKGAQIANFAGVSYNQKKNIGQRVSYYAHGGASEGLYINPATGRLEKDGEAEERGTYAVLQMENADSLAEARDNRDILWGEKYNESWDETDTLAEYLGQDGLAYAVMQEIQPPHNSEAVTLEIPANIKGVLMIPDWDNEADKSVPWHIDTLKIKGGTDVQISDVIIEPAGEAFNIAAESENASVDITDSEIKGNLTVEGTQGIVLRRDIVNGTVNAKGTLGLEEMLVADGLSGYSKLNINGYTLLLVRNPKAVVIENCEFVKTDEDNTSFDIVYNGYPENTSALPVFNDNIVFPPNCGMNLRFVQKSGTEFWNVENWWEKTADESLPVGTQLASTVLKGEKFESLMQCLWYYAKDKGASQSKDVELAGTEDGKIVIQQYGSGNAEQENDRPVINSVLFPKKQESYSAVYTGEQIRPVMVVAYSYSDANGRAKTQKLKLNVDYTVTYSYNVDVTDAAEVTVKGIGEYSGEITKTFKITPKSIEKVTLSAVGDIVFGGTPTVTVMDGTYELVEGQDFEINLSNNGSEDADTQSSLTVKGIGNYEKESKKSAKFNILKSSTEIKNIASDSVTVEFKKLPAKGYTYNGKAQKPAVVVKDGGVKVPSSQYKVIYSNNINAGTQTASVRVVGVSKKGKGYYGISEELKFDIKQKSFAKVSVSSIAAVPKTQSFEGVTMTVKDGKRILTEGEDFTVDYSNILNSDGSMKDDIVIGKKYAVTLRPVSGGNYTGDSSKIVNVKFGQLNLASKTANISAKITNVSAGEVEVRYNGVLLAQNTDYTAQLKQDKNKSTYTVTVKAVKNSAYKGKRVFKNVSIESN